MPLGRPYPAPNTGAERKQVDSTRFFFRSLAQERRPKRSPNVLLPVKASPPSPHVSQGA